jgi:hypothetical protein
LIATNTNGEVAPIPAIFGTATEPPVSTLKRPFIAQGDGTDHDYTPE